MLLHRTSQLLSLTLIALLACGCVNGDAECIPEQRSMLLDLKHGFVIPPDVLVSWKPDSNCCNWRGITCDPTSGSVIGLDLSGLNITGGIDSDALFGLTSLQFLDLSSNRFDRISMPQPGFEKLKELRRLNLSRSGFAGQIPAGISHLTSLEYLDLSISYGDLRIVYPVYLTRLEYNIYHGNLRLEIPDFHTLMRNLSSLLVLKLDHLDLNLDVEWSTTLLTSAPQLQVLSLRHTNISGSLNKDLFQLKRLEYLDLSGNAISGVLPDFPKGCALQFLYLSGTNISGSIPDSIGNLENLTEFKMMGLDGWRYEALRELPYSIFNHTRDLQFKNLTGAIPASIGSLTQLALLDLSYNNIAGEFPSSIGRLSQLAHLDLSHNRISGSLNKELFQLKRLEYLDLSGNTISGVLPDFSKGRALQFLYLSGTNITGSIPDSIGNLENLKEFKMMGHDGMKFLPTENLTWALPFECLTGAIPASIGSLTQLAHLDLSYNSLTGAIPSSIGKLLKLTVLDLADNTLTGPIPGSVFSLPLLQTLDLGDNYLSGELDVSLNASASLKAIDLINNQLCGQIPPSIFYLPSLEFLSLESNNFSGAIELDMNVTLRNLSYLFLSNNKVSFGELNGIYTFPNLRLLGLAGCGLTKVPTFMKNLHAMDDVDLSNNKIGGDIPRWIFNIGKSSIWRSLNLSYNLFTNIEGSNAFSTSGFTVIDLSSNMLQGSILLPPPNTTYLDFSHNNFSAIIPPGFFLNLKKASYVSVANNTIIGEIPPSICEASTLDILDLSRNLLSGSIPSCLLENGSLYVLNLGGNQLKGTIPQNINEGCQLKSIIMSNNHLEGTLPRSLVNCSGLQVLDLANNQIFDLFPFWLGDHVGLQVLSLKANRFYGPLRLSKSQENNCFSSELRILDLSSNHFHGDLSLICFSGRSVMRKNNSLSPIPPLYNMFGTSTYYENSIAIIKGQEFSLEMMLTIFYNVVDFSNNSLEGGIPRVIGELQLLQVLNLSHNSLTGKIPFELGDLAQLESLDLSANNLSGEIPQHLTSLTSLGTLNLSSNNLVGSIPQGGQFSARPNNSFQDNPGLCGIPLLKLCGDAKQDRPTAIPLAVTTDHSSSSSSYVIGLALSVGIGYGVGLSVVLVFQNVFIEFWKRLGRC